MTFVNNWHRVWSGRALPETGTTLERLIAADGFDTPLGYVRERDWRDYVALLSRRIGLGCGDSVFEVGCGSGAFLFPLAEAGHDVGGIDYSDALVKLARAAMPAAAPHLEIGDARQCAIEPRADAVIANHVIHYFESLDYATTVIDRMLQKARRVVALSGVPDAALQADSERERRGLLTAEAYAEKYRGLELLYYPRPWLERFAAARGFAAAFFPHEMPGFAQNPFRFDCVMTRNQSMT